MGTRPPDHAEAAKLTILNVDDHVPMRYVRSRILKQAGFDVDEAGSGREALERASTGLHQLILLDVNLPDMSGFEVCRRIKGNPATSLTPVLHVSATCFGALDKVAGLDAGSVGYLTEPVEPEVLVATIKALLRERQDNQMLDRLAAIVECSEDAIYSMDLHGRVLTWNAGAERLYGYSAGDLKDRSISTLLPPERQGELTEMLGKIRRGERIEHFQTVRLRKDGRRIQVSLSYSPLRNARGGIVGSSGIARDMTEQKRVEEQLMLAEKLVERLGVLAGGIAHNFNNLLTGIMGNASLAMDDLPPASPAMGSLAEVVRASERAAELTSQMLAYAGMGRYVVTTFDFSELIRRNQSLIGASVPQTVQLRLELADGLPPVEADAVQMQQLVLNLLLNAAESIEAGKTGTVVVRTGVHHTVEADRGAHDYESLQPGSYVALEVSDTGRGMDQETLSRIFDPFFSTKFTGRGLGLSAVLGIVRAHGGAIRVTSSPGCGSTFRIFLPVRAEGGTRASPADATVLVVDDEAAVRSMAKATLEHCGYRVLLAESGRGAIDLFRRMAPEVCLVILDLTMPGMSGDEVIPHLREIRPDVPVVATSGYNEETIFRRLAGKGVAGFIQKPYTWTELALKVKSVLDSPRPRTATGGSDLN
jgi:PAS domain S-box-containing protein